MDMDDKINKIVYHPNLTRDSSLCVSLCTVKCLCDLRPDELIMVSHAAKQANRPAGYG